MTTNSVGRVASERSIPSRGTATIFLGGAPHPRVHAPAILMALIVGMMSLLVPSLTAPVTGGPAPATPIAGTGIVEEVFSLPNQPGISNLAYSPDGAIMATVGSDASVWLRNADNRYADPIVLTPADPADPQEDDFPVAFSPDGSLLAVGRDDGSVHLWDTRERDTPRQLRMHVDAIADLAFSPDGAILVTGSWDGTIRLQDLTDPDAEPAVINTGSIVPAGVAISPDGALLAADIDNKVGLWQLDQLDAEPFVLEGHESDVGHVAFSPDGMLLASGGDDHTVRVWDMTNLNADPVVLQAEEQIHTLAFSPDGTTVAAGGTRGDILVAGVVWLWNLNQAGHNRVTIDLPLNGLVEEIAWRPGSTTLAVAYFGGTVRLLDTTDLGETRTTVDYPDVMNVALDPAATTLAAAGPEGEVWLWDLSQPRNDPDVIAAHPGQVSAVTFSPDGARFASAGFNIADVKEPPTVRVWNPANLYAEPVSLSLQVPVSTLAFSPDGNSLAISLWDGTVRLWDLNRPDARPVTLQTDEGERVDDPIWTLAFSPDGRHLAGGDNLGAVWIWNLTRLDAEPLQLTREEELTYQEALYGIAFSPDGHLLAAAGAGGNLLLWDLAGLRPVPVDLPLPKTAAGEGIATLETFYTGVAFGPDGDMLVMGGINNAGETVLHRWNLADPGAAPIDLAAGQGIGSPIWQIVFNAGGSNVTTATMRGTVHHWSLAVPVATPVSDAT